MNYIQRRLFVLQDEKYRDFTAKLIPTVEKSLIIGVRTPALKALAKELKGGPEAAAFIKDLPHEYYEENNLHGLLICAEKDFGRCVAELDRFLPQVDNWASCDMLRPVSFKKRRAELLDHIRRWTESGDCYTVRFGLEMLMCHYLDGDFFPGCLELAAAPRSEEYYVRMMQAWFFATALAKRYEESLPYVQGRRLEPWTRAKTIQKAIESDRISGERKAYLRTLR